MAAISRFKNITVGSTAVRLWEVSEVPAKATSVLIQNQSAADAIRIGNSTVTNATGIRINYGEWLSSDAPRQEIYAISETGNNVTVGIFFECVDF